MSATIVCKDGTTIPAAVITACQCEAAYRRGVNAARCKRWREANLQRAREMNAAALRKSRARKRGAA